MHSKTLSITVVALVSLASEFAFAAGEKTEVKGMIFTRTGETLVVKTADGNVTVVLTDSTRTKDDTGLFGLGTDEMSNAVLIPGLKVDVDGTADKGRVIANKITIDGDDLETSEMIQAGLHPTAQQVAANVRALEAHNASISANRQDISANREDIAALQQKVGAQQADGAATEKKISATMQEVEGATRRFTALADYDVKAEATVKFASGSASVSDEDTQVLKTLAGTATGLTGYIVEVTGFADATGDAAMNTKLSEDRAKAVITLLMQQGGVPVRHIVAPGAMGEYGAAASNETAEGRAENRRVEVKVLVNKGIAGQ
jgi:outer membrane protein OmpA-like peptidoglycan-associated protein